MQNSFSKIQPGKMIGGYVVIRQIGLGATSSVYEVKSKISNNHYALKLFDPCDDKDAKQKKSLFLFEANRLRKVADQADKEARIIKIHEICTRPPFNYYVMDLVRAVDGNVWSLDDIQFGRSKIDIPYTEETLIGWFLELARTLIHLHDSNILHCDIKPTNILIDKEGRAILVDYGSSRYFDSKNQVPFNAKLSDFVSGTQEFMPFEALSLINKRIRGRLERPMSFTPAYDVYSLGATFWQLLFDEPLSLADDPYELIMDGRHKNLIDDQRWVKILPRMLERNPSKRIALSDCVDILNNALTGAEYLKIAKEREGKMNRRPTLDDCDKKVYDSAYCKLMKQMQIYDKLLQKLKWESGGKVYEKEFVIRAIYDRYRIPELKELKVIYGSKDKMRINKAHERLLAQDSSFMDDFVKAGLQPLADALFFKLNALWSSVVDKDDHSYSEVGKAYIEQRVAEIRCYLPYEAQFVFGKYRHIKWDLDSEDYFVNSVPLPRYRGERAADRLFIYERTIAAYVPHNDVAKMQIDSLAKRNKLEGLNPAETLDMKMIWKFSE